MNRKVILTLAVSVMVLLSVTASGIGAAQTTPDTPTSTPVDNESANESENNTTQAPPGLQISATLGVLSDDVSATLDRHMLGHKLQTAETQAEKQEIINNFVENQKEKVNTSENISNQSTYEQTMSISQANTALENSEYATEMAQEHNVSVNESKLNELRNNASNMTGQEVSAIARSLAGPPDHANGTGERGPPTHAGEGDEDDTDVEVNETVASEKLTEAEAALADARNDSNVSNETIAEVESDLEEARNLYEKAQNLSAEDVDENETETEVDNESEEADTESELEEERQDLYEEVYDLSSDSIEELEEDSTESDDSEENDNKRGNSQNDR